MSGRCCLAVACAIALVLPSQAANLTTSNDGVVIDAGTFGKFTLTWPQLELEGGGDRLKPVEKSAAGQQATLKYAGGAGAQVTIGNDGSITYAFSNPPANMKSYRMDMLIDFSFHEAGTWTIGDGDAKPFPADKPDTPFLFQGNATNFKLTNFEARSLLFSIPAYSFQQLQDNREWNWSIFAWMFIAPFDRNNPKGTVTVRKDSSEAKRVILVDRFGQDAALDFPGKIDSVDDLKADAANEEQYYQSLKPPQRDAYGGVPGSGQQLGLQQTGFFHVENHDGRWYLVTPEGNATFHLGICGFGPGEDYTYIKGREQVYEWLPGYDGEYHAAFHTDNYWSRDTFSFYIANQIRKYGEFDREANLKRMIHRVKQMGFNASGAFSGGSEVYREVGFPYVSGLPLGQWNLGHQIEGLRGLFDPFDQPTADKIDELFGQTVKANADQPLLIGYFLDNEQAFEDIPKVIPQKTSGAAKERLVEMLAGKYPDIAAFNTAWGLNAKAFGELTGTGLAVTTEQASADMHQYAGIFIDAYYKRIRETFDKYDPNHMLLGNRWQPGTANNEQLCGIAGKYCDLLSLNYYTYALDTAFLERLNEWAGGKPWWLSEFYWTAPDECGLPGGKEVKTQTERGLAYRNYVEQAAATGYVVGIEWFTLIDQARTGRFFERYNGERANTGIFNVADRPYQDYVAEASKANADVDQIIVGKMKPFVWDDPRFQVSGTGPKSARIARAVGPIKLDGTRNGWPGDPPELVPGSRLVLGADAEGFDGSFRMCWDDDNLYLLVVVNDPTPMRNNRQGNSLWNGDAIELFIAHDALDQGGPLRFGDRQILLSAGEPQDGQRSYLANAPSQVPCQVAVIPAADGKGYTIEAAIPHEALGFKPAEGTKLLFDLAIDDGDGTGRQRQLMWSGGERNSGDRTAWGRAVFLP